MNIHQRATAGPATGLQQLRLSSWAVALGLALPFNAWAVGLGDIELLSRYSQPFSAKVPVVVADSDQIVQPSDLQVRLLPLSAYEERGLAQPPLSTESVQVSVSGTGQAYWIALSSAQRVREPMMTLLLEIRHGSVRVIRELPVIFDLPADLQAPSISALASSNVSSGPLPRFAEPMIEDQDAGVTTQALTEAPVAAAPALIVAEKPVRKPSVPAKARNVRKAPSPKVSTPVEPSRFQLADWNQSGQSSLPRFRMAETFNSYRELARAGQAPAPASVPAPASTAQALDPLPQPASAPIIAPQVPANLEAPAQGGWSWLIAVLLGGLGLGWVIWKRRQPVGKTAPVAPQRVQQPTSVAPVPAVIAKVAAPAAVEPTPAPVLIEEAAAPVSETVVSTNTAAVSELKRRLAALQARNSSNLDVLRKAQLVEAYLDLQRLDSAELLLAELEGDAEGAARPKFTLIKG